MSDVSDLLTKNQTLCLISDRLSAENAILRDDLAAVTAERDRMREALKLVISDIIDYERANKLYPNPGKQHCWQSVRDALVLLEGVTEPASPWRDIESAPKDMKILVAGKKDDGTDYQEVCKYFDAANCWPIVFMHGYLAPTHWMHLQEPPR